MTLPPAVRTRLKPLLLMMSSDIEGERQAAAAAIGRVLKASDADWHDLADALTEDSPSLPAPASQAPATPRLKERGDGRYEIHASDLLPLVEAIRENSLCSRQSLQFLDGLEERACLYRVVVLSSKQVTWLTDLLARVSP